MGAAALVFAGVGIGMTLYNSNSPSRVLGETRKAHLVDEAVSILEGNLGSPVRVVGTKSCTVMRDTATISVAMSNLFANGKLLEGVAVLQAQRKGMLFPEWELDKVFLDVDLMHAGDNSKGVERIRVWSAATASSFAPRVPELSALPMIGNTAVSVAKR